MTARKPFLSTAAALALGVLAGCTSAATSPIAMPAVAATPREGPALWKVADHDTTIYLFGTVHALPKDVPWLRGAIGPALESADTLVTEVDLGREDPGAMQKLMLEKAALPAGQTLRGLLSADQRARYEAGMAKLGVPAAAFDGFKPWYATFMFTLLPLAKAGIVGDNGVEQTLYAKVGESKARASLETVGYQLSVFDTLPRDVQIDYLMDVIDGNEDVRAQLEKMMGEWLEGDADGLAALMNEDMDSNGALLEALLYQRNRTWAGWIANRLETPGTVFMAVGAGHLAGPQSVQADLGRRGIESVRVQ